MWFWFVGKVENVWGEQIWWWKFRKEYWKWRWRPPTSLRLRGGIRKSESGTEISREPSPDESLPHWRRITELYFLFFEKCKCVYPIHLRTCVSPICIDKPKYDLCLLYFSQKFDKLKYDLRFLSETQVPNDFFLLLSKLSIPHKICPF